MTMTQISDRRAGRQVLDARDPDEIIDYYDTGSRGGRRRHLRAVGDPK